MDKTITRIGVISDTHNFPASSWNLQPCDILIHCGDFSFQGSQKEINQFFKDMKYAAEQTEASYIICVPGNHEVGVEKNQGIFRQMCKDNDIICLIHESIEIENIKFFGSPFQNFFCNWAWNVVDSDKLYDLYCQIPSDTDVLITHCPPHMMLDYSPMCGHVGSKELWTVVQRMLGKLKYHFFGHIHYSHGIKEYMGTKFVNSAIVSDHYSLNPQERRMQVFEYG